MTPIITDGVFRQLSFILFTDKTHQVGLFTFIDQTTKECIFCTTTEKRSLRPQERPSHDRTEIKLSLWTEADPSDGVCFQD